MVRPGRHYETLPADAGFVTAVGHAISSLLKSGGWLFYDPNRFRSPSRQLMVSNPASTMAYASPMPQREEVVPHGHSQHAAVQ